MSDVREVVIISGRSGAGKTTAAHALEDLGFFVVDNLPVQLFKDLMRLSNESTKNKGKLALVIDARNIESLHLLPTIYKNIKNVKKCLVYLDALEHNLISRYQTTKRRHPLDNGTGIKNALRLEEEELFDIKNIATFYLDTSSYTPHELKNVIKQKIVSLKEETLDISLLSFGFKHGIPNELDLCFDVRFLKNPYYEESLRNQSGVDKEVSNFVLSLDDAKKFMSYISQLFDFLLPLYKKEGKSSLNIAFGCTGGRHRSVAIAQSFYESLRLKLNKVRVEHRDLNTHY